jgi:methylthioribulose-1-phosphate dehydratase
VDRAEAAEALAATSRALYARGWMDGTSGNLSVRLDDGPDGPVALVTASGRSKGTLSASDVVAVDVDSGRPLDDGDPKPSAETAIHLALYRSSPGCRAVVHAHAPYATVVAGRAARAGEQDVVFADYELIKGLPVADPGQVAVPVFENFPDVRRIAEAVARRLQQSGDGVPGVLLLAYHGATAWGPDLDSARNRLECLEGLCQLRGLEDGAATPPARFRKADP